VTRSLEVSQADAPGDLVELGRITGAYGIRGWVKIQPYAAGSEALLKTTTWWLCPPAAPAVDGGRSDLSKARSIKVEKSRTQGSNIVASLAGTDDRTRAERLRGHTIWVSRASFPAPEEDEYYWVDLIGCTLYGEQEGQSVLLGVVEGVMDNGIHAVLRIVRQTLDEHGAPSPLLDAKGRAIETLVPFVAAHVHTVDLENRRLDSNWPADF